MKYGLSVSLRYCTWRHTGGLNALGDFSRRCAISQGYNSREMAPVNHIRAPYQLQVKSETRAEAAAVLLSLNIQIALQQGTEQPFSHHEVLSTEKWGFHLILTSTLRMTCKFYL